MTPLREREIPRRDKFRETESTLVDASNWGWVLGRENRDLVFNGDRVSV